MESTQLKINLIRVTHSSSNEIGMNVKHLLSKPYALVLAGMLVSGGLCGCQTQMGGQTLPSAYYLRDDVQFFPAGPERQLPNLRQALEEYNATGEAADAELEGGF